jgi:hypothetical protein
MEDMPMSKIRRDNRVIFWLLIGGLVMNILWSLRLELQAKTTQTLVEKYHFNLNQGSDMLIGLKEYLRRADGISIKTNDGNMFIEMVPDLHQLTIGVGKETITIGKLDSASDQLGNGILLSTTGTGGSTYMLQTSKGIHLNFGNRSEPFYFDMSRDKESIEIRQRGSFFQVGKTPVEDGIYQGVFMGEKNFATLGINKDEGIGLRSLKEINLSLAKMGDDREPFHLNMSHDKELIEIRQRGSFFQVGKAPVEDGIYQGVFMGEKNFATLGINKDEGIGLRTKERIILNAERELIIEADGDINIKSKNGVVKINGKKIHLNK